MTEQFSKRAFKGIDSYYLNDPGTQVIYTLKDSFSILYTAAFGGNRDQSSSVYLITRPSTTGCILYPIKTGNLVSVVANNGTLSVTTSTQYVGIYLFTL